MCSILKRLSSRTIPGKPSSEEHGPALSRAVITHLPGAAGHLDDSNRHYARGRGCTWWKTVGIQTV